MKGESIPVYLSCGSCDFQIFAGVRLINEKNDKVTKRTQTAFYALRKHYKKMHEGKNAIRKVERKVTEKAAKKRKPFWQIW